VLGGDDFIKAFYDAEKFFGRDPADSLAEALNGKRPRTNQLVGERSMERIGLLERRKTDLRETS